MVLDNGIVQVTIANPEGSVTGIQYNGVDNLLETLNEESNRGYVRIMNPSSFSLNSFFILKLPFCLPCHRHLEYAVTGMLFGALLEQREQKENLIGIISDIFFHEIITIYNNNLCICF